MEEDTLSLSVWVRGWTTIEKERVAGRASPPHQFPVMSFLLFPLLPLATKSSNTEQIRRDIFQVWFLYPPHLGVTQVDGG